MNVVAVLNFLAVSAVVIHRQGPTHKKMAIGCMEDIISYHFHMRLGRSDDNRTLLLSVIIAEDLTSPAFEIREVLLRGIHRLAKWYLVETISSEERHEFESYTDCSESARFQDDDDLCENNFIIDVKSDFNVIVVDSEWSFHRSIEVMKQSKSYTANAFFLVYIESQLEDHKQVAQRILLKMREELILKVAVLVPVTLQIFYLYKLSSKTRGPNVCGSNVTLINVDRCTQGRMNNIHQKYFGERTVTDYLNCSLGVVSTPYDPFVIDENRGFEMEVLRTVGTVLNINFNITQTSESQVHDWGQKDENGSWTGKLELIFDDYYIGIGNIDYGMPVAQHDFDFSRYYHMEDLVYVVPIAGFVPKWRVLVAIFTVEMWGVCLGIIVGFAISFFLTSKLGNEVRGFRILGQSFLSSFQIIISHAVFQQPISELTRVFFLSMAICSIMMSSAYTSSLVYYLTNPIREHQPTTIEELKDVFGNFKYEIGGVSRYKELFNTTSKEVREVYKIYQTVSGENDTVAYWINQVGDRRNIWTISSKLYANHLVSKSHSAATYPDGTPKVFVFKNKLMAYSVCMLAKKGHPVLRSINSVIRRLVWGGIVAHFCSKYQEHYKDTGSDEKKPLTIDHLQGAFSLLVLGYLFGILIFIGECLVKRRKKKIRRRKMVVVKKIR